MSLALTIGICLSLTHEVDQMSNPSLRLCCLLGLAAANLGSVNAAPAGESHRHRESTALAPRALNMEGQQSTPAVVSVMSTSQLPIAVDGHKTPGLVPDALAYHHFILSVAVPANPTPDDVARQERGLANLRLSAADRLALRNAVSPAGDELEAIASERKALSPEDGLANAELADRERSAIGAAKARLEDALSADGLDTLRNHIDNYVKRSIVIYGQVPK